MEGWVKKLQDSRWLNTAQVICCVCLIFAPQKVVLKEMFSFSPAFSDSVIYAWVLLSVDANLHGFNLNIPILQNAFLTFVSKSCGASRAVS